MSTEVLQLGLSQPLSHTLDSASLHRHVAETHMAQQMALPNAHSDMILQSNSAEAASNEHIDEAEKHAEAQHGHIDEQSHNDGMINRPHTTSSIPGIGIPHNIPSETMHAQAHAALLHAINTAVLQHRLSQATSVLAANPAANAIPLLSGLTLPSATGNPFQTQANSKVAPPPATSNTLLPQHLPIAPAPPSLTGTHRVSRSLSQEERRQRRLMRNRIAAKECRQKKKTYVMELEQRIKELEDENDDLRHENEELKSQLLLRDADTGKPNGVVERDSLDLGHPAGETDAGKAPSDSRT
ncbi:uncharacterized protein SPPG_08427 [Spizellomyces punctatus DAOM BR117]|uniref:BZIP domain-containing protein n=1 Tax=Spizellomyces punctatus (strain DAOM BR117) TaxID=645134 RepID=A0A0L0H460_SPIPD|nr:uncharacterized protein SPPG_08427 [Spizellomyces punctatus DAOM BR117]KNC96275.1 hypothetical protein SPPG_08427 [Spizellomyces punctatus DAOM BR117]|eukprot:XP_016604315.1 hypothetical protein SPPG_08427 [Spizellomyces punctatus DAOM BR117]